jgi:hypothetical protein
MRFLNWSNPSIILTIEAMLAWSVADDFSVNAPVTNAELDAVEAYLMPLVNELVSGYSAPKKSLENPQKSVLTSAP